MCIVSKIYAIVLSLQRLTNVAKLFVASLAWACMRKRKFMPFAAREIDLYVWQCSRLKFRYLELPKTTQIYTCAFHSTSTSSFSGTAVFHPPAQVHKAWRYITVT